MGRRRAKLRQGSENAQRKLDRRSFLATWVWTAAASQTGFVFSHGAHALAASSESAKIVDHYVPTDKRLPPERVAELQDRGQSVWYRGSELATIGMPVGGVAAGLVYLTGDGRLVQWDIFNELADTGPGGVSYREGRLPTQAVRFDSILPANDVAQGTAIRFRQEGRTTTRTLDARGFSTVEFRGEYPIGRVSFEDEVLPLRIKLEAFSPFIPLNADDSTLPVTVLNYAIENTSEQSLTLTLASWLENAVMKYGAPELFDAVARTYHFAAPVVLGGVRILDNASQPARTPIVFSDFEGNDYRGWKAEGESFGNAPASGTLPGQQQVTGYQDEKLVNSFVGGDGPRGRLVSPSFIVERPWIGFLLGGGRDENQICINLIVDDKVVRSATGKNNERLEVRNWNVTEYLGKSAHFELVDRSSAPWGHINVDQIEFRDHPMPPAYALRECPGWGTMALSVLGAPSELTRVVFEDAIDFDSIFDEPPVSEFVEVPQSTRSVAVVRKTLELKPGECSTVTVLVGWSMPNLYQFGVNVGQHYSRRFATAADVLRYTAAEFDRLKEETFRWRDTFYNSTLPYWLLDRIGATVSNLATTTCEWWRNGRFWAYEGCGSCHGTCGHVWNYAQALARLFPPLERSVREMQDFNDEVGFDSPSGAIAFRGEGWPLWAGDAQGGYILKAYREHLLSPDNTFLNRNWKHIRHAMQFLIDQDGDSDGLLEGKQHNTYDIDYYGANTMVGSLYLGALRAAEEMARIVGDRQFAELSRRMFEAGRDNSLRRLFNGEYFNQDVDLHQHPEWQYGDGCLSDQLLGQFFAYQVGLGILYSEKSVNSALRSIWKYNWSPDVTQQNGAHHPERWFARPSEAGLFVCTWPKSMHPGDHSTRYRDEVWTGIEYQVAASMAHEGLVTEALAICRAVHDRYHPAKRNPFNEVECGDHYARSLASWGMIIALSGFEYNGPRAHLGFIPRLTPNNFASVFTAAEAWGRFTQRRSDHEQSVSIEVAWGHLPIQSLALEFPSKHTSVEACVRANNRHVSTDVERDKERIVLRLRPSVLLCTGEKLIVTLKPR